MLTSAWYAFYECTVWSCLQVSYILLLREAYIASTRNDTSGTSGDSDKSNSFIQVRPPRGVVSHFTLRQADRYRAPKTPYHLWTCRLCSSDTVETEFHFVMLCPALDHLRSTFFSCLSNLDNSFTSLTLIDKFKYILSANNHCKINLSTSLVQIIIVK